MNSLSYTLLSDGPSDRALLPILTWLLNQSLPNCAVQREWADLARLPNPPKRARLDLRIKKSIELYQCDLLFVHRDAESLALDVRIKEIEEAVAKALEGAETQPTVCAVPVQMTEAWLLIDERAIRSASGNPNGDCALNLPRPTDLELLSDPKSELCQTLEKASGLTGRRRIKKFKAQVHGAIQSIPRKIDDFSPLRNLPAFQRLEDDLQKIIKRNDWA